MILLAFDIALNRSGFAVLAGCLPDGQPHGYTTGAWRTHGRDRVTKLEQLRTEVKALCDRYGPDAVAIEDGGNWERRKTHSTSDTSRALAMARGVALAAAQAPGRHVWLVGVDEWHREFTGDRCAGKATVQHILRCEGYELHPWHGHEGVDPDEADALALGLVALRRWQTEQRIARARG